MAQQNADFSQRFVVLESDGVTPFPLTGFALRLDVKNAPGSVPVASYTTGSGGLVIEPAPSANAFDWSVTAAQMAEIDPDLYWFDVVATGGGFTIGLGGGFWIVTSGITNSLTPSLPAYGPADLSSDVTLQLLPGGVPGYGAFIANFPPVTAPAAPLTGWTFFTDVADGAFKIISSAGTITPLAYP